MRSMKRRITGVVATAAALSLGLAACSGDSGEGGDGGNGGDGDKGTISIGIPAGWDEGVAVSYLWKAMLEDEGYTVKTENADIGVIFTSLAGDGGYNLLFDGWLPTTHKDYYEKYGDDIEDLGVWYDQATLNIAVNEDSPAQTIGDLKDMADQYNDRLVGIDPGAGLTRQTKENVIPEYGLENLEFVISSTSAMLAELKSATDSGENIAVTLWHPHWAYDAFPIRDLEDPKGALGDAEKIHTFANEGFSDEFPDIAEAIGNFKLSDEQLASLENLMLNENEGNKNEESAATWLEDNPDFQENLLGGSSES